MTASMHVSLTIIVMIFALFLELWCTCMHDCKKVWLPSAYAQLKGGTNFLTDFLSSCCTGHLYSNMQYNVVPLKFKSSMSVILCPNCVSGAEVHGCIWTVCSRAKRSHTREGNRHTLTHTGSFQSIFHACVIVFECVLYVIYPTPFESGFVDDIPFHWIFSLAYCFSQNSVFFPIVLFIQST